MKTKNSLIVLYLSFFGLCAQYKEVYILDSSNSQEIIANSDHISSTIYRVEKKRPIDILADQQEVNEDIKTAIALSVEDSIQQTKSYQKKITLYKNKNLILRYIDLFINSSAPYHQKKKNLVLAQKLANLHNIDLLIFADKDTNPTKKMIFLELKRNKTRLDTHLKKIIRKIKKNTLIPEPFTVKESNKKLHNLRVRLTEIEKEKSIFISNQLHKQEIFILGDQIDGSILSGSFIVVQNADVIITQPVKPEYKIFIINKNTEEYYCVKPEFLKKFEYNTNSEMKDLFVINKVLDKKNTLQMVKSNRFAVPDNINNITYSIEKYEFLIKKCKKITTRLKKHNAVLQKGVMNALRSKQWKSDIEEAISLNKQITEFLSIFEKENYPFEKYVDIKILDSYNDFSKTLISFSKNTGF